MCGAVIVRAALFVLHFDDLVVTFDTHHVWGYRRGHAARGDQFARRRRQLVDQADVKNLHDLEVVVGLADARLDPVVLIPRSARLALHNLEEL